MMEGMVYNFSRYRVFVAKDEHGLGLGIEKFVTTVDSLYEAVVAETGHRVIRFASIYVPKPVSGELSNFEGLCRCVSYIDSVELSGERILLNIPSYVFRRNFMKQLRKLVPNRDITFRNTPPRFYYTERDIALDALRRRTTIEEVLFTL
ncbi:hypothetical protein [Anoxybacillus kestanbolensis]|uniref:hypothetical protein n=1 Tax=Anoxybacillus kestanbolensis TaxID=227476 RepID=UPI003D1DDD19